MIIPTLTVMTKALRFFIWTVVWGNGNEAEHRQQKQNTGEVRGQLEFSGRLQERGSYAENISRNLHRYPLESVSEYNNVHA